MSLAESNIGHLRSGDYWTTALCNPSCSSENVPSGAGFRVELRHLRHFIGVAKELHFACTAERLETGQHRQATRFRTWQLNSACSCSTRPPVMQAMVSALRRLFQ